MTSKGMAKSPTSSFPSTPDNSSSRGASSTASDKKKKSIIPKIFSSKKINRGGSGDDVLIASDGDCPAPADENTVSTNKKSSAESSPFMHKSVSERGTSPGIEGLNLSNFDHSMASSTTEIKEFRIYVATWNVGGRTPDASMNLEDFLQVDESPDLYICGFQEIVPLSAGNVLVIEDSEPAAKWLALISQTINRTNYNYFTPTSPNPAHRSSNKSQNSKETKNHNNFFHKPSVRVLTKNLRADSSSLLKICNCAGDFPTRDRQHRGGEFSGPLPMGTSAGQNFGLDNDSHNSPAANSPGGASPGSTTNQMVYNLISCKQMVGIFLSVWARQELVPHIGHLRASSCGTGIMGCLGNKGCIAISMSLHRTSFCFVCSHLASGEKEGDELKRNSDVAEILKSIQFPKICKNQISRAPERIADHDRVLWFGDLNYRISLSYEETKVLLEENDWDTLLDRDQLNMERDAGRVFDEFYEGRILFAPTYKYSHNSDSYAGETVKNKKKRRTPAWCDRVLWKGRGMEQMSYGRVESRFSDHRPVCAIFAVDVEMSATRSSRFRKGYSCTAPRIQYDNDCLPHQRQNNFYGY